jgi:DNA-binding response OmpR family regulator
MTRKSNPTLGVIDGDAGFRLVLEKRLAAAQWELLELSGTESIDDLLALKLSGILIDVATLERRFWEYLDGVSEQLPGIPLMVMGEASSVDERVRALRRGADDWIGRPCHAEEVVARAQAILRRKQRAPGRLESRPLIAGSLEIRPDRYEALVDGENVGLTRREFEVLHLLAAARGKALERDEIYQRVWGYDMAHGDRSVDVFVRKLRQKLERPRGWRFIHTHHGVGYRFDPEHADQRSQPFHNTVTAA